MGSALGALTPAQVDQANAVLNELAMRLAAQHQTLQRARTAGVSESLVGQALSAHRQLMEELDELSDRVVGLPATDFGGWLEQIDSLGQRVALFEDETLVAVRGGSRRRTAVIVVSTLGAIAAAGAIAALVWYGTQPGAVLARKRWRKRGR
jgi:hypothetical protein